MEILISADTHVHAHKKSSERLQDCLETLEWIFHTAEKEKIPHVAILGDLFQDRYTINVKTYQLAYEVIAKYADRGLKIWLLVGNHDMWFATKWTISSMIPLGAIDNVTVINKPCTLSIDGYPVSFLPYTVDPISDLEAIDNDNPHRLLFGHVAIDGAAYNLVHGTYSDISVEHDGEMVKVHPDVFYGWDKVFLGHYHNPQSLTEIVEYVGSPLQLDFGEAFQQKHLVVWNLETQAQRYIDNTFSPTHVIAKEDDLPQHQLKGNFISVITDDMRDVSAVELRRALEKKGVRTFEVKTPKKKHDDKEEKELFENAKAIFDNEEGILERFIRQKAKADELGDLKEEKAIRLGKELIAKSKS